MDIFTNVYMQNVRFLSMWHVLILMTVALMPAVFLVARGWIDGEIFTSIYGMEMKSIAFFFGLAHKEAVYQRWHKNNMLPINNS